MCDTSQLSVLFPSLQHSCAGARLSHIDTRNVPMFACVILTCFLMVVPGCTSLTAATVDTVAHPAHPEGVKKLGGGRQGDAPKTQSERWLVSLIYVTYFS